MRKTRIISHLLLVISLLFLMAYTSSTFADSQKLSPLPEHKIRAVYIYKFIHFIWWSEESLSADNIVIGILGDDPFGNAFSDVEEKEIKSLGKKLVIKKFDAYSDKLPLKDCHILFISVL